MVFSSQCQGDRALTQIKQDDSGWRPRSYDEVAWTSARHVIDVRGRSLIQVCSTQYLSLPWSLQAAKVYRQVLDEAPAQDCTSLGSPFLGGTHPLRRRLEAEVALESKKEAGLAFASGWAASYAAAELCGGLCDLIISDRRSHNSTIHGLKGSKATVIVEDLNDQDWVDKLSKLSFKKAAILSPSLEGISGQAVTPNIPEQLRERILWVQDECHSFGAVGIRGTEEFEMREPDIRILGFSKACGTSGAVVCGPHRYMSAMAQMSSPWMFSTAQAPILWQLSRKLLPVIVSMSEERRTILKLASEFRSGLREAGLRVTGRHHISGVALTNARCDYVEDSIREAGFFAKVSQYPSRPKDSPCMRIVFGPTHAVDDVIRLSAVLRDCV